VIGPGARFRDSIRRQADAFAKAAATFDHPATRIGIPYEGTTLPGYYFQCSDDDASRPLLVVTDGYDGTLQELYFAAGTAALERGYNVLVFDGPGQGSVITEQGLPFRPDWENVITPVIDHALTLPGVDPTRIALMGWSFGGYLAPRAATGEHRIAACISDSGPYDLRDATLDRIPGPLATRYLQGSSWANRLLGRILATVAKKPTMGWALRRNVYVHDVDNPLAFLDLSADYTMRGREDQIVCPTFVCTTEGDDIAVRATDLAAGLRVPHAFVTFQNADGVHGHCEMTGRAQFHRRAFDWLDHALDHTPGRAQPGRSSIADREVVSH
jgi:dienelactone hydrolase